MGQEKTGLVNEETIKAVGAFGGGIASSGSVCGILLGGIALISSMYSRGNLNETENPRIWALSNKFMKEFDGLATPYGGMNCRDIAQVDWHDRVAVKNYYANPLSSRKKCIKLVGDAAYLLGELLEQEASRK